MVNDNDARTGAMRLPSDALPMRWMRAVHARLANALPRPADPADAKVALSPEGNDGNEMRAALRAYRNAFVGVGIASGLISLLSLTGPLFMLQIYDRVLPSRSVPTLVGLGLIVLVMFGFQGLFEMLRGRVLLRIGRGFDRSA